MVIAFLMNILILGTSFIFTSSKSLGSENRLYRLLAFAVFFYAQIIFIELFWGVQGKLYLVNLLLSCILFFVFSYWFIAKDIKVRYSLKVPAGIFNNKVIIFCLSLIMGFGLIKIAINLINPPFGWDSLNYHFTFPVEWLKSGNLHNPITINDDLGPSYYPINGSLIYLWFILPLKNVFLADLGQIPFFIISFIALYGICRRLNITKEYAFFASSIFTITPNYFKQLEIAYVDVMVCGWFLAGLYFLIEFYYQKKLTNVVLFAFSTGLLIGTKTISLLYGGVLFILFIVTLFAGYDIIRMRRAFFYFAVCIFIIIVFGGYGYIRNFLETGNPLYPLEIKFLGNTIFTGVYDKATYASHVSGGDYAISKILFHEGMGAGLILFLIPGFLFYVFKLFKEKITLPRLFMLLIPIILYFVWRYLIPLANLRYLYPALAVGYIAPFYFLPTNKKTVATVSIMIILCFLASISEISSRTELIASILLSILLFFGLRIIINLIYNLKVRSWIFMLFVLFVAAFSLNNNYNKNEYSRYVLMTKYSGFWPDGVKAWKWLNDNTSANNIAYVGRPVSFPLYGTNFKNNVFYVSVNQTDPVKIHYFKNSNYKWGSDFTQLHRNLEEKGNYREDPNYEVWMANLRKRKVDYLFVYSLHQTKDIIFPVEDVWAGEHRDNFDSVFTNASIHIFKIR